MKNKPTLSFWDIWNMSFGFFGIQFGFALQGGFMSKIFINLGADQHDIPGLWIAAPLAGLIVQPVIGYLSDRTWSTRFGRRKPYFLIGAILASIALFFMPYSSALWIAAGALLMLDASINVSMEPFRALVADKLNESQRSYGFLVQTLIIGIGTWVASQLPRFLTFLGFSDTASDGIIPDNVKIAFGIGAVIFLLSILYTIITTKEYPPDDLEEFRRKNEESKGFLNAVREIADNIVNMPSTMKKLGLIQFFSWFAFFTMWSMATPSLTSHVYQTPSPVKTEYNLESATDLQLFNEKNAQFNTSADLVGSAMGMYGLSSMAFAFILSFLTSRRTINRKYTHMVSLFLGALGFLSMALAQNTVHLNISFALVGVAWGSILSLPYAMLSSSIDPKKMGIYMGLFNMFIVIPQIIAAIGGINILSGLFGNSPIGPMLLAGCSLLLAGCLNVLITDPKAIRYVPGNI